MRYKKKCRKELRGVEFLFARFQPVFTLFLRALYLRRR